MLTAKIKEQIKSSLQKSVTLFDKKAILPYQKNTLSSDKEILAVIEIHCWKEMKSLLKIAVEHSLPIHPISTGKNWGYGCATPNEEGCILLDLSGMNQLTVIDRETGIISVEPGVTQAQLYSFLVSEKLDFLVPTTGAGPTCSILGNILERGYGMAPMCDHTASLISVKAMLSDQTLYTGSMPESSRDIEHRYPYSVGPDISKLFIQSNIGIVIEATLQLSPKPERSEMVFFSIPKSKISHLLPDISNTIYTICGRDHVSNISIINPMRLKKLSENSKKNTRDLKRDETWVGFFCLYGTAKIVSAMKSSIKKNIKIRPQFLSRAKLKFLLKIASRLPWSLEKVTTEKLQLCSIAFDAYTGIPTESGLQLIYENNLKRSSPLNPTRDNCGLIWFSPIIAIKKDSLKNAIDWIEKTLSENFLEAKISFTTLNKSIALITVPIVYIKTDLESTKRAKMCYERLTEGCQSEGMHLHRLSIDCKVRKKEHGNEAYCNIVRRIKQSLDNALIISPGRYDH